MKRMQPRPPLMLCELAQVESWVDITCPFSPSRERVGVRGMAAAFSEIGGPL